MLIYSYEKAEDCKHIFFINFKEHQPSNDGDALKTEVILQQGTENNVKTKTVTWTHENKYTNVEQISAAPLTTPSKKSIAVSTAKSKKNKLISSIKRQFLNGNPGKFNRGEFR